MAINLARSVWRRRVLAWRARGALATELRREPPEPSGVEPLLTALRALPPRQRAAVSLRFYDDLSVAETARAVGCREGTVKALTAQGVAALRKTLHASLEVDDA